MIKQVEERKLTLPDKIQEVLPIPIVSVLCETILSDITVFGEKHGAYEILIFRVVELGKVNFKRFPSLPVWNI